MGPGEHVPRLLRFALPLLLGCGQTTTLYCPQGVSIEGSPETSQCAAEFIQRCGTDREAVIWGAQSDRPTEFYALGVVCDADDCVCEYGTRRVVFNRANACEDLRSRPTSLVREGCEWDVEFVDDMDPEVQHLDDIFGCVAQGVVGLSILALSCGFGFVWWRRRRS